MAARARLIPAPGRACCRSARFGGAIRGSTRRGLSDCWIVLRFLTVIGMSSLSLESNVTATVSILRIY